MDNDRPGQETSAATPPAPEQLGRYELLRKLGQGGMGAVYLAHDTKLDRRVALKVLPSDSVHDPDAVARFRREARALAKLCHPGIVQAYDSEEDAGKHLLVLEYVEGTDLKTLLSNKGARPPAVAADYVHQAAEALSHAHGQGLVHRDLKPSNLLLTPDGRVKLLDLGLARFLQDQVGDAGVTREGVGMGTPDYAAPEQFRDARHADPRADIYALGCTLYHLLAGRVPFPGSSLSEKCRAHEQQQPTPLSEVCPEAPAGLALVLERMMAKRPADRFQTAREAAEALAPYVANSAPSFVGIRNTSSWSGSQLTVTDARGRRYRRRGVRAAAGLATVLTTVVFGALLAWSGVFRERPGPGSTAVPGPGDTGQQKPPEARPGDKGLPPAVPDDPNVLTVSQDPKDGGTYRTIGAALEQAKPGMTVRVLDAKTYPEMLSLRQASRYAGITLEAPHRATLAPATTKIGLTISRVPGVTVRGFRLQAGPDTAFLIDIDGQCPGVVLEDLEFLANATSIGVGIELLAGEGTDAPVLVRGCVFRGLLMGICISGVSAAGLPAPCGRILVRNNALRNCRFGVCILGAAHDVHVVGNRIEASGNSGVFLQGALEGTRDLLIANNTLFENYRGFQFFDDARKPERGKRVALRNNLILGSESDLVFLDSRGTDDIQGDGDGAALLKLWQIDHNAREADPSKQGKGWIPAGTGDVVRPHLDGLSRKPDGPDSLRPDADSPLATGGAGVTDPSLPRYVGALPPKGVEPWDWERTWRMPRDARLLTVSKDPADKPDHDTLAAALAAAKPWTTIRVLDRGTYTESLTLDQAARHEGICLEAVNGATLLLQPGAPAAVRIRDVGHVRLAGFRIGDTGRVTDGGLRPLISVTGKAPGVALQQLHFQLNDRVAAVTLDHVVAQPSLPVVVAACEVQGNRERDQEGIDILGPAAWGPSRNVCLRDNRISGVLRGVAVVGRADAVQVSGNLIWNCGQAGLHLEDLAPTSDHILLANNTAARCGFACRVWDNKPDLQHRKGQVELKNNLLLESQFADLSFIVVQQGQPGPGDGEALLRLWPCRGNRRDCGGGHPHAVIPLAAGDGRLELSDLAASDFRQPENLRPRKGSALAAQEAGTADPALPAYVGALPPEGVEAWDWNRTWNARVRKGTATSSPDP